MWMVLWPKTQTSSDHHSCLGGIGLTDRSRSPWRCLRRPASERQSHSCLRNFWYRKDLCLRREGGKIVPYITREWSQFSPPTLWQVKRREQVGWIAIDQGIHSLSGSTGSSGSLNLKMRTVYTVTRDQMLYGHRSKGP